MCAPLLDLSDLLSFLSRYNPALEEIVTAAQENPESDGLTVCEPFDFGCIIETETLGTEAGEAYLHDPAVIASTAAETIEDIPEDEDEETNPTDTEDISDAGSKGDPHCKSARSSST